METSYTEKCSRKFVNERESYQCRIKFEVWYSEINTFFYYDDESYFNLQSCIKTLDNYLQECKFHKLNWHTWATVGIDNSSAANYSQLCFKRNLRYLTRLDIRKR